MIYRITLGLGVVAGAALVFANPAAAQSVARIPERVASDSAAPDLEDFAAFVDTTVHASADHSRAKSIKALKALLARDDLPRATRFKALNRLARAYRLKAESDRQDALADYRGRYRAWLAGGSVGDAPKFDGAGIRADRLKAVEAYRSLVSDFADASRLTEQKLDLAVLLAQLGDSNAALYFRDLAQLTIDKQTAQIAKLGLAELALDQGDTDSAQPLYVEVAKGGNVGLRNYALYRLGWVAELADDAGSAKAIEIWSRLGRDRVAKDDAYSVALAARQDLTALWAQLGTDEPARAYFAKLQDPLNSGNTLERIGFLAAKANKALAAAQAYQKLTKVYPHRANACVIDMRLTALYSDLNDLANARQTFFALNDACLNTKGKDAAPARKILERTLLAATSTYFKKAMTEKGAPQIDAANAALSLFLADFPKHDQAYPARYELAQVLDLKSDKERAAKEYFAVARSDAHGASARPDAARRMLALQRDVVAASGVQPPGAQTLLPQPAALPASYAFLVDVIDAYVRYLPTARDTPAAALQAAKIKFDFGSYGEAVSRFDAVSKLAPRSPEGEIAVKAVLAYAASRKDWTNVITWGQNYLKRDAFGPELTAYVLGQLRNGMWQHSVTLDAAGQGQQAAKAYLAFQARFPADHDADRALARGSELDFKDGHGPACLKAAAKIIDDYPKSSFRGPALLISAEVDEASGDFEQAAHAYQTFAREYVRDAKAPEAFVRGSQAFLAAENKEAAANLLLALAAARADAPQAVDAPIKAAKIHEEAGNMQKARAIYSDFAAQPATPPELALLAKARAAIIELKAGQSPDATARLLAVERSLATLPNDHAVEARDAVAAYRFAAAATELERLPDPAPATVGASDFEQACAQLKDEVGKRDQLLSAVAAVGSPTYTAAAAVAKGTLYDAAVALLREAKSTPHQGQAEAYRITQLKERLVLDYSAKALANFRTAAAATGPEASHWRRQAQKRLADLEPARLAGATEILVRPSFVDQPVTLAGKSH